MSLPKTSDSYPPEFLAAITRALEEGELAIPTPNPAALRFRFNGLRGAMRRENRGELIDMVSFHITPDSMIIRSRAADPLISDVASALGKPSLPSAARDEAETLLARLLGENP